MVNVSEIDVQNMLDVTKRLFIGKAMGRELGGEWDAEFTAEKFLEDPETDDALCNAKSVLFLFSGDCSLLFASDFLKLISERAGSEKHFNFGMRYEEISEIKIIMFAAA